MTAFANGELPEIAPSFPLGDPEASDCQFSLAFHTDFDEFDKQCSLALKRRLKLPEPKARVRIETESGPGVIMKTSD